MTNQPIPTYAAQPQPTKLILLIDGRSYGQGMVDEECFHQDLPPFCKPIVAEIHELSELLKLKGDVAHDVVFHAYGHDVQLLNEYMSSIEAMAKSAIEHSVIYSDRGNRLAVAKQWKVVEQKIPAVAQGPFFNFTAEKAAWPSDKLLRSLQESFRQGVDDLMRRMCFWFDLLVSEEFVGLVQFTSTQAGKYFYYRHRATEEVVSSNREDHVTVDESQPFGQRKMYTTTKHTLFRHSHQRELHEHHIVRVEQDAIADYAARVPSRVKRFLEGVPAWLRPHLVIVSGQITVESVVRKDIVEHEVFESRVVDTWKGSPAATLGSYALLGWSDDDLQKDKGGSFSKVQSAWGPARMRFWRRFLLWSVLAVACAAALIRFI